MFRVPVPSTFPGLGLLVSLGSAVSSWFPVPWVPASAVPEFRFPATGLRYLGLVPGPVLLVPRGSAVSSWFPISWVPASADP